MSTSFPTRTSRLWHAHAVRSVSLSQPFFVATQFTGLPGVMVPLAETIRGFKMILNGELDHLPEQAFLNVGTIDEAIAKGNEMLKDLK